MKGDTNRKGGVGVQLVFGSDSKAGAIAAGCPGQVHSGLQLVVDLLIDGPSKLGTVVTEKTKGG